VLRLILHARQLVASRLLKEDGQGLTEYALIIALVVVIAIIALGVFGAKVTTVLSSVARSV
jgi:Flp pilus assembly pilin Flp